MSADLPEPAGPEAFRAVINQEQQYSIWPDGLALPEGWRSIGFAGSESRCLDHIERLWTDMRPASVRRALAHRSNALETLERTAISRGIADPQWLETEALRSTSIVIALKDDERIFRCLASVDEDVEVVLSLNGTPAALRQRLTEVPGRVVLTSIGETGNLGAAYNAGIEKASGRYILLMDSDCVFDPGVIRGMAAGAARYPVVKGQVIYGVAPGRVSAWIARIREFDEGDYVSALSPPLIYDRGLASFIGGHHFNPLIHWCEDREFDFRLQLADVPVQYDGGCTIRHDAQVGFQDFRSYWRYGVGEGIGQRLGIFTTPALPLVWRLASAIDILVACARAKGVAAALYYSATLAVFHCGTLWQILADPYRVRARLPSDARRLRMLRAIPQHCPALTDEQKEALRNHHRRAGRDIPRRTEFRLLFEEVSARRSAALPARPDGQSGVASAHAA
jgi:uncharacterized protein YbdZ (MbtH family)